MNCQEAEHKLDAYALEALDAQDASQVASHLHACALCAASLAEREHVAAALREQAALRASGQAERIVARLRAARPKRHARRFAGNRLLLRVGLPLAASLLAVLGGVGLLVSRQTSTKHADVRVEWFQDGIFWTTSQAFSYPVVTQHRLFALRRGTAVTRVAAFDRASGRPLWETPVHARGPLIANEQRVFAWEPEENGRNERTLIALDAATGALLWQLERPEQHRRAGRRFSITLSGQTLFLADGPELLRLNTETGETLWSRTPDSRNIMALSMSDKNKALFAVSTESLLALDPADGMPLWSAHLGRTLPSFVEPLIEADGHTVFLAHRDFPAHGRLAGHDARTGALLWEQATATPFALRAFNERVYLNAAGMNVFAGATGARLWSADIEGCSPVAVDAGAVYLVGGIRQQTVMALDLHKGTPVWTIDLAGSCSGLVVDGDHGYVSGHNGALYALALGGRG